jgi:peptidoglycan/LPS O-acetylase OafA/YrhL
VTMNSGMLQATNEQNPGDMPSGRVHFTICDGIRAVAILLVVLGHLSQPTGPGGHGLPQLGLWGVATFFILSGFLLGRPYVQAIVDGTEKWPSYRLFLTRRFLRIVPLYETAVVFSVAVLYFSQVRLDWRDILAHVFFLQNLSEKYSSSLNSPLWTMPVDICFYIGMPLLMYGIFICCRKKSRTQKIVILGLVIAAAITMSLGDRAFLASHQVISREEKIVALRGIIGSATSFALGLTLACIDVVYPTFHPSKLVRICLLMLGVLIDTVYPHVVRGGLLNDTTFDLAAGTASFAIILATWKSASVAKISSSKVVVFIAGLSYGVYLFHEPIVTFLISLQPQHNGYRPFALTSLGTLALLFPLTYLTYTYIEKPMLKLKAMKKDRVPLR